MVKEAIAAMEARLAGGNDPILEARLGKLYLFVAIDRTSKFAYAELHEKANRWTATHFLKALIKAVPYKIHTVLTDNGIQFTDLPENRFGLTAQWCPYVRHAL